MLYVVIMNPLCGSVNDEQGAQCVSFKGLIYEYIFMFRPSGSLIANLPVPVELCLPVLAKYSHDSRTRTCQVRATVVLQLYGGSVRIKYRLFQ